MAWFDDVLAEIYPVPVPETTQQQVVDALNVIRKAHSLGIFVDNAKLDEVSQAWSDKMATSVGMTHGAFGSRISAAFPNTYDAENIAAGQPTIVDVMRAWMLSLGHRMNILGNYNQVGVGITKATNGEIFWCTDFVRL